MAPGDADPVEVLLEVHRAAGLPDPPPGDEVAAVLGAEGLADRVVWAERPAAASWPAWRRFLEAFGRLAHDVPAGRRPRLAVSVLAVEAPGLPRPDVSLPMYTWDGWVSGLDMLLYAAGRLADHPAPYRELLASVAARVAVWDPEVVDRLAELPAERLLAPAEPLAELARERGWGADQAPAWAEGTQALVDGHPHTHSALLALGPDPRPLARRLWSAQASVLLPLIELRRQELVPRVRRWLRLPVETPGGTVSDPFDLEVSELAWLLGRGERVPAGLAAYAQRLRRLRNALAHLEPVAPADATAKDLYRPLDAS